MPCPERKESHAGPAWTQIRTQPTATGRIRGKLVHLHPLGTAPVETIYRRRTVEVVADAQAAMRTSLPPVPGNAPDTLLACYCYMSILTSWVFRRSCGPLPTWDEFFERCEDIRPSDSSDVSLPPNDFQLIILRLQDKQAGDSFSSNRNT